MHNMGSPNATSPLVVISLNNESFCDFKDKTIDHE